MRKRLRRVLHRLRRPVMFAAVILAAYLLQACIMPHFTVFGVVPSILFAVIAVITVSFDKYHAYWAGAFYGIVLEVMQPTVVMFNLLMYPITALFGSVVFSDKSVRQLEYERSIGKAGRNVNPFIRIPLCAMMNVLVYEVVNVTYVYLRGAALTRAHFGRAFLNIFLTTLLAALLMWPLRRLLGIKTSRDETAVFRPKPYEG